MENSMDIPQNLKNITTIWSRNPMLQYTSEGCKISISKGYLLSHVHCNILTTARIWKQPESHNTSMNAVPTPCPWAVFVKFRRWQRTYDSGPGAVAGASWCGRQLPDHGRKSRAIGSLVLQHEFLEAQPKIHFWPCQWVCELSTPLKKSFFV